MNPETQPQDRVGPVPEQRGYVVAVCISAGGIPKNLVQRAKVTADGLLGDGHDHGKHCRPERAVSMLDLEMLRALQAEGYPVGPGIIGENLTVSCVHVQRMSPGDRLCFDGGPVLELTEARKPCFVLDKIHPALKEAVVGRCGYLARVASSGHVFPGQRVAVVGESGS